MSNNETLTRIFIIMMCMNAALVLSGVQAFTTNTEGENVSVDFARDLQRVDSSNSSVTDQGLIDTLASMAEDAPFIGPLIGLYNWLWYMCNFFLAGGIIGFLMSSGMPYELQVLIGVPVTGLAILSTVFVIRQFWRK